MKRKLINSIGPLLAIALASIFLLVSCSSDQVAENEEIQTFDFKLERAETSDDQIAVLTKAMRKYHNFQVAQAQGYIIEASPFVPGMGFHYVNPDYVDGTFDILNPEILVYYLDQDGNKVFGAAEYLIPIPGCDVANEYSNPPEGFIGSDDSWFVNCTAGGWTLHAWVGLENPEGVFVASNNTVPNPPN
ncbi:MAG: hypothetical protein KJP01_02660 [Gramella sp.]|nr:hypothetical protein [Christiangramia sp.]MBT8319008.1 hypothetical protein [Christiangramia sp.]